MCSLAWMAGWREIDWRGNGLIVLTLTAGMQIALREQRKRRLLRRGEPCVRGANQISFNDGEEDKNALYRRSISFPWMCYFFRFTLQDLFVLVRRWGGGQNANGADSVIHQPEVK